MSKLLDGNAEQKQAQFRSNDKVVEIPTTKKLHCNRQQNFDKAQVYVLPLPNKQFLPKVHALPVPVRVLLVDKDIDERRACRKAFRQYGKLSVELVEAVDGEEGLSLVGKERFDCVLLDYVLPDMTGMEFWERLVKMMDGQPLPVLELVLPSHFELAIGQIKSGEQECLLKDDQGHYLKLMPAAIRRLLAYQRMACEKQLIESMFLTWEEHIPAITYVASLQNGYQLLYVGRQLETLGYSPESWLSDSDLRFRCIFEEDRPRVEQAFVSSLDSGETFRCEYRVFDSNGKLHWFHDEAAVVKGQDGRMMSFQGVMRDITDKKVMENELQEHRYFLEKRVHAHTEQLEKRIQILESCNRALCNRLENELKASKELRKTVSRQEAVLRNIYETSLLNSSAAL